MTGDALCPPALEDAITEAAGRRSSGSRGRRTRVCEALRIQLVDACRRADEAVSRLGDDEGGRPRAHDPAAILEDHLRRRGV